MKRNKKRDRETEGQQLVHISVISIYSGQGKHHIQLTIHSCSHTVHLFCERVKTTIEDLKTILSTQESQMQTHDCIMFTNFLQNIQHLYGLYYIHSESDDKLL